MKSFLVILLCAVSMSVLAASSEIKPAGVFEPALDPDVYARAQFAGEYYPAFDGYHTGEDWGLSGANDANKPLYALATGRVVWIDNRSGSDSIGKTIYVRYKLPDGAEVDSVYIHLASIEPGLSQGSDVSKGQRIATIGNSNGYYGTSYHLHWEMQVDLDIPLRSNSYLGGTGRLPMSPSNILKYTSPSLFVDDRSQAEAQMIFNAGAWNFFTVDDYAPSSTAYLNIGDGDLYTIQRAVDMGKIASYGVIFNKGDGWRYYHDVMAIVFEPGVEYAIWLRQGTGVFYTMPPGHNWQQDRAFFDMVREAEAEGFDLVKQVGSKTLMSYSASGVL
jgi:hypothetical protein